MSEILDEITAAIENLHISDDDVRRCSDDEARTVVARARAAFVTGNPRVWWLSLKVPAERHPYVRGGHKTVANLVHRGGGKRAWFIPETEGEELPVFECSIDVLASVLGKCSFFEYYVLSMDFTQLVIDTDHNELLVCKSEDAP